MRLSICIPTYNFGEFLGATLESIIAQADDRIEIVVGDGASTDNTEEVVKAYQSRFPHLVYQRFDQKGGIDLDLAKTVDLATGEYCWFMSSDDLIKPGAIQRVLIDLASGQSVYLCNRTVCSRGLRPKRFSKLWLSPNVPDRVYYFWNKPDLLSYLNVSQSIGALFSYMSSIVVRREKWIETGFDDRFAQSNYAHVFRLFSILCRRGNGLGYIRRQLVLFRGDNDSFRADGYANRIFIDLDGYRRLAEYLFVDEDIRIAFKTVMKREHKYYILPRLKTEVVDMGKWHELERLLSYYGYNKMELFLINVLGSSATLVNCGRSLKRMVGI